VPNVAIFVLKGIYECTNLLKDLEFQGTALLYGLHKCSIK